MSDSDALPLAALLRRLTISREERLIFVRHDTEASLAKVEILTAAAMFFNLLAVDEFGGRAGAIRGRGLVDQVVAAAFQIYGDHDPHPKAFDKAAMLLRGITQGHPFSDGNKRTGFLTAALYLDLVGYPLPKSLPIDEIVQFSLRVSAGALRDVDVMAAELARLWGGEERQAIAIHGSDSMALAVVASTLDRGGLVVIPTDTVYGVAARLDRPEAVARLYVAKGRPEEKPIPVLISSPEQLARLTRDLPVGAAAFAAQFWPGALTVALPRSAAVPDLVVAGGDTVGLRMPDHPFALALIAACGGALAVTSANRSGEPSLREAAAVAEAIGGAVDLIVDGGTTPGGLASTVVALDEAGPRVLREGPIDSAALRVAWARAREV